MRVPGIPYIQGRNSYTDPDGRHYGVAIHCTANTASARAEANYASTRTDGVSAHFYVDAVEIIQSLDSRAKAGHAGSTQGNDHAIAVEITGLTSWSRSTWLAAVAWGRLGAVVAELVAAGELAGLQVRRASVAEMKTTPTVRAFYGHDDMRQAWGGTTHTDPGPNFPWDRLFQAVTDALGGAMSDAHDHAYNGDAGVFALTGMHDTVRLIGTAVDQRAVDHPNELAEHIRRIDDNVKAILNLIAGGIGPIPGVAEHTHTPGPVAPPA